MTSISKAALAAGVALSVFHVSDVQAQVAPAAATAAAVEPGDIFVTGTRAGERKAIEEKRKADNFVEAIYANDVGKLPDQNVAEAVRRIPGLSVANDQGEGRYVIIRGINPDLVNVTLNGMTLPAPEPEGRQVKLDDIPSALINAVVVTKSLTADQDANAIGGSVDIRTLSAFDRNKRYFADARIAYGWSKLNDGIRTKATSRSAGCSARTSSSARSCRSIIRSGRSNRRISRARPTGACRPPPTATTFPINTGYATIT